MNCKENSCNEGNQSPTSCNPLCPRNSKSLLEKVLVINNPATLIQSRLISELEGALKIIRRRLTSCGLRDGWPDTHSPSRVLAVHSRGTLDTDFASWTMAKWKRWNPSHAKQRIERSWAKGTEETASCWSRYFVYLCFNLRTQITRVWTAIRICAQPLSIISITNVL